MTILIKLGGSLITDKRLPRAFRRDATVQVLRQIKRLRQSGFRAAPGACPMGAAPSDITRQRSTIPSPAFADPANGWDSPKWRKLRPLLANLCTANA